MKNSLTFAVIMAVTLLGCTDSSDVSPTQIAIHNGASQAITTLILVECPNSPSWGSNKLRSSIPPGKTRGFPVAAGCWNIMGKFTNETVFNFSQVGVYPEFTSTVDVHD